MGERRVISKFIPPDFDPSRLKRQSRPQNKQSNIRFMFPFTIKCSNCGEIIMRGTKGNARKELCVNEDYLGISVYRLYMRCKSCYSEIILKTDPKNMDYSIEKGGIRETYFEPWAKCDSEDKDEKIIETEKESAEKKIHVDIIQTDELEQLRKERLHLRRPKLSDLKKIYQNNESINHNLTLSDRNRVRNFDEFPKNHKISDVNQTNKQDSIKLQQIKTTNFFTKLEDEIQ